ncbi:dual specificity protein kinase CLK2-like protein, partial [Dinothrombium tinctorium]
MKSASSASYSSSSLNSALSATTRQEHYDNKHKKLKEKAKSLATITTKENKILTFEKNQLINGRYSLTAVLGEGTFGKVFAAVDSFTKKLVALKIITNREHDETAKNEVEILEKLSRLGPTAKRLFVEMIDYQFFSSHSLIVFEMLGFSIYDYQKQKDFEPYPIINIRDIGYQICYAV